MFQLSGLSITSVGMGARRPFTLWIGVRVYERRNSEFCDIQSRHYLWTLQRFDSARQGKKRVRSNVSNYLTQKGIVPKGGNPHAVCLALVFLDTKIQQTGIATCFLRFLFSNQVRSYGTRLLYRWRKRVLMNNFRVHRIKGAYRVNNARSALRSSCALFSDVREMRDIRAVVGEAPRPWK